MDHPNTLTASLPRHTAAPRPDHQVLAASARHQRDADIAARRRQGMSLAEIADEFGLTRERVRQIVAAQGGPDCADVRRIRQVQDAAERAALRDRCLEHLRSHPGLTLAELCAAVDAEPGDVRAALGADRRRLLVPTPKRARRVSDEDLLGELRLAAGLIRGPLTGAAYDRIERGLGLHSRVQHIHRFGTWARACELAGVTPGKPRRAAYTRAWTPEEMLGWVATYLRLPTSRGTYADYAEYARRTPGAPSAETVRVTIGPWSKVKAAALRLGAERLGASSPSIEDPCDELLHWEEIAWADLDVHQRAVPRRMRGVLL